MDYLLERCVKEGGSGLLMMGCKQAPACSLRSLDKESAVDPDSSEALGYMEGPAPPTSHRVFLHLPKQRTEEGGCESIGLQPRKINKCCWIKTESC